jgi:hypothetical protein
LVDNQSVDEKGASQDATNGRTNAIFIQGCRIQGMGIVKFNHTEGSKNNDTHQRKEYHQSDKFDVIFLLALVQIVGGSYNNTNSQEEQDEGNGQTGSFFTSLQFLQTLLGKVVGTGTIKSPQDNNGRKQIYGIFQAKDQTKRRSIMLQYN